MISSGARVWIALGHTDMRGIGSTIRGRSPISTRPCKALIDQAHVGRTPRPKLGKLSSRLRSETECCSHWPSWWA
jgi:hypothetical protein